MEWLYLVPSFLAIVIGIIAIGIEITTKQILKEWQKLYDESE